MSSSSTQWLKVYAILSTIAIIVLFYLQLGNKATDFKEINVQRINVKEANGDLKLVISNSELQHPGAINGQDFPKRKREAGFIFFNNEGDECGGFVYDGNEKEAGMVMSYDKYKDDQIMQLQYMEDTKTDRRKYGLQLWEFAKENTFPERRKRFDALDKVTDTAEKRMAIDKIRADSLLSEDRLFIGKNYDNDMGLFIKDKQGRPRIRIYVDRNNQPKMEMLDENGVPTNR